MSSVNQILTVVVKTLWVGLVALLYSYHVDVLLIFKFSIPATISRLCILRFPNLGIQCAKKRDVPKALKERQEIRVDPFSSMYMHL